MFGHRTRDISFYFQHALNDLRSGGRRTLFVLLCVAVGVAAVVSLQTLGAMIENGLVGSLQEMNRGDIRIDAPEALTQEILNNAETRDYFDSGGRFGVTVMTIEGVRTFENWFRARDAGVEIAYEHYFINNLFASIGGMTKLGGKSTLAQGLYFNFDRFPLYGEIYLQNGAPIGMAMKKPTDVVISETIATEHGFRVGDQVTLNGAGDTVFTISGIVDLNRNEGVIDLAASILGTYYVNTTALPYFTDYEPAKVGAAGDGNLYVVELYIKLSETDPDKVEALARDFRRDYPMVDVVSTANVRAQNQGLSDAISRLVLLMGLLSLLIGGIGIINTMLVVVARRQTEIAILKTIGLQAHQISALFLIEALVLGLVGSLFGIGLGILGSRGLQLIAESTLGQTLEWVFPPVIAARGLALGLIITALFALLPTLIAGQVRPNHILRPTTQTLPRASLRQSRIALAIGLLLLAGIVWSILGFSMSNLILSIGVVLAGSILIALLTGLTWLLVTLLRRLPEPPWVDFKLALRLLTGNPTRVVTTMLALVVGIQVLGLLTMVTVSLREQLQVSLVESIGGNAFILTTPGDDWRARQTEVDALLQDVPGVQAYSMVATFDVDFVEVIKRDGSRQTLDDLVQRVNRGVEDEAERMVNRSQLGFSFSQIDGRSVSAALPLKSFSGDNRQLRPTDSGQRVVVLTGNAVIKKTGIEAGDILVMDFRNGSDPTRIKFTVVGVSDESLVSSLSTLGSVIVAPLDAFGEVQPQGVGVVVQVQDRHFSDLRDAVAVDLPGAFVLDTRLVNALVNKIIERFAALPLLVAALALVSSSIVIANSVALSTLERRREIATLKAVGVQRERVLGMLLMENSLLGLVGGLLGVGLAVIFLLVIWQVLFGGRLGNAVPLGVAFALMGLCVVVAVGAALGTAWGASSEKPLTVLRGE